LQFTAQQKQLWSLLDTFDWLAPQYDLSKTVSTARQRMKQVGIIDIEVLKAEHLVARGTKLL
jgi:hypothetical protein